MPELLIRRDTPDDRLPLSRMLELYNHDLSEFWPHDLDIHGEYGYELDRYWTKPEHYPFVVLAGGKFAGFALVNDEVKVGSGGRWMDQFFVVRKYRRTNVGRSLAKYVFLDLPGNWEVGQIHINYPAQVFWRSVIGEFTSGAFVEHTLAGGAWEGIIQSFQSTTTR